MDNPLIEQVRMQAHVLVPLIRTLRAELGEERANALVRKALGNLIRGYGEKWWQSRKESDLGGKVRSAFGMFAAGDALQYDVVKEGRDGVELHVTRCRYAEFYKKIGAPELGFLLTCSGDADFFGADGFDADVRLSVPQTIMQGASHCVFRYERKPREKDTR